MQQALRVSDQAAFFLNGVIVETGETKDILFAPPGQETEDYISGKFGWRRVSTST